MPDGSPGRRDVLAGFSGLVAALAGCAGSDRPDEGGAGTQTATEDIESPLPSPTVTSTETTTPTDGYERTTVTAVDANGTELAAVDVRIADTPDKRYLGLSDTTSLAPDEGMLFTYEQEDRYAYVMREMSFPLDIIFVDGNGTVTRIHHAAVDDDGRFVGRGRYVLEVNRGWANRTGVTVGDRIEIPPGV